MFLALLSQREGTFKMFLFPLPLKPPRLRTAKIEMKAKIRWKIPARRRRLLPRPTLSEDRGVDKKRKRVTELLSSSTSAHMTVIGETSTPEEEVELFDLLDS
jgi:hypothetical protein